MNSPKLVVAFIAAAVVFPTIAADWPQYAGPHQNRSTPEKIQKTFPSGGPKAVWRVPTPGGFSSFAVSGGKAFTLVMRNIEGADRETLVAMDANTGKELWFAPLGPIKINDGGHQGADDNKGGDGPRATPSVDGNSVYVNSSRLVVSCFDAESGKSVWSHDLLKDFSGRNISWGNAASALVDGDLVFIGGGGAGQSLIAFDKATGKVAWKAHDEKITHSTPVAGTILGQRQVIFFTQSGLISVNPKDGALLWKHPFRYNVSTAISPVIADDIVYCAAGYGVGATAARISKDGNGFKATQLWISVNNKPVANHWSTPVYHDGHLYGMFSFKEYGDGPLKCVELATGKVKWEQPGFGAGNVVLVGNTVLALSDKGELIQVEPTPTAYKELSRAKVVTGKCWSTPTVANGRIYVRSTKEAACFDAGVSVASK
ncbi:MAG TPA: PQQ-binding-like beta-propeller repeat protein [Candidatus Acidoferrum sp.]|nr:PQQ-binding-like beta-propeller repeat protein [Candidatus Acidoferrum sp.]